MLKKLFNSGPTSKTDVVMALGALVVAAYKAVETIRDYNKKEITK